MAHRTELSVAFSYESFQISSRLQVPSFVLKGATRDSFLKLGCESANWLVRTVSVELTCRCMRLGLNPVRLLISPPSQRPAIPRRRRAGQCHSSRAARERILIHRVQPRSSSRPAPTTPSVRSGGRPFPIAKFVTPSTSVWRVPALARGRRLTARAGTSRSCTKASARLRSPKEKFRCPV